MTRNEIRQKGNYLVLDSEYQDELRCNGVVGLHFSQITKGWDTVLVLFLFTLLFIAFLGLCFLADAFVLLLVFFILFLLHELDALKHNALLVSIGLSDTVFSHSHDMTCSLVLDVI